MCAVLAFDILVQRTKKGKWSKKIVIVSDFTAPLELDEDLDTIVAQSGDIDFDFVGINCDPSSSWKGNNHIATDVIEFSALLKNLNIQMRTRS